MLGVAVGVVGMSVAEFWAATPREVFFIFDAYSKHNTTIQRAGWEQMRVQTTLLVNMLEGKKKTPANKLIPFEWDKEQPKKAFVKPDWEKLKKWEKV